MKKQIVPPILPLITAFLFFLLTSTVPLFSESDFASSQNTILIVDLTDHYFSVNQSSADSLKESFERLGYTVATANQMPSSVSTSEYSAVFCCTGIFPANGVLSDTDIQILSNYLSSGGRLYLEGGDVWYYDPIMYRTGKIETLFGIESSYDGNYLGDVDQISGFPTNLMDGISFTYEGFVNYTDFLYLDPQNTNVFNVWDNQIVYEQGDDPFMFPAGVACDVPGGYKTIGVCFEFSGIPFQKKESVLTRYMNFFLPGSTGKTAVSPKQIFTPIKKSVTNAGLSPQERALNHKYPKLFNEYTGDLATEERIDSLAYWDFLVLNTWNLINKPEAFGPAGAIRKANPNNLVFIYFSAADYIANSAVKLDCGFQSIFQDNWLIKDVNGDMLKFFQLPDGSWTCAINLSTQVNQTMPFYLNKHILKTGLADGIYYDWINEGISWVNQDPNNPSASIDIDNDGIADSDEKIDQIWVQGTKSLLTNSRTFFPDSFFVIGNGGSYYQGIYNGYIQGMMNEGLNNAVKAGWDWHDIVRGYYLQHKNQPDPVLSMIQFNGVKTDYQCMRYGLSLALILGAYYQYTSEGTYQSTWWYDEYAVNSKTGSAEYSLEKKGYLGEPVNQAYSAKNPQIKLADLLEADDASSKTILWRRDFTYGTVFCNPTSQPVSLTYEEVKGSRSTDNIYRIKGTQDTSVNNGQKVTTGITIPAEDGLILLVDCVGTEVMDGTDSAFPAEYELKNIFPNPFNSTTEIRYSLPEKTEVKINVINVRGEKIMTIFKGMQNAGRHSTIWDASGVPSGVYVILLVTESRILSKKCLLLK